MSEYRYKPTAVRDERAKAFVPPAQRAPVAMEIEKDRLFFAGWHVPKAVSSTASSASDKPIARGAVRRRSGKYCSERCAT
jgi:hypothetical protein